MQTLRAHLARITADLTEHKALVAELRAGNARPLSPPRHSDSVSRDLAELRREVERLGNEVRRLGGIIEEGLDTRRKARVNTEAKAPQIDLLGPEPAAEDPRLPSALRQGLHTAGNVSPTLVPPTIEPPTRVQAKKAAPSQPVQPTKIPLPPSSESSDGDLSSPAAPGRSVASKRRSTRTRVEGPGSPFPSIRMEDERDFFDRKVQMENRKSKSAPTRHTATGKTARAMANLALGMGNTDDLPPQTVLARVLRELEDDFPHYKASVYSLFAK